jgi:hypothetical protein
MANRTKVTQQKRARERAKQERQQEKTRRREEARTNKPNTPQAAGGEDPDIAGIIPGPQPIPWNDDDLLPAEKDDSAE